MSTWACHGFAAAAKSKTQLSLYLMGVPATVREKPLRPRPRARRRSRLSPPPGSGELVKLCCDLVKLCCEEPRAEAGRRTGAREAASSPSSRWLVVDHGYHRRRAPPLRPREALPRGGAPGRGRKEGRAAARSPGALPPPVARRGSRQCCAP